MYVVATISGLQCPYLYSKAKAVKYVPWNYKGYWRFVSRPRQGRVKGNRVICPCLPLPSTYLTMMALAYLYFHLVGLHLPLHFTPLTGNSHFNGYNTFYLLITLYHKT